MLNSFKRNSIYLTKNNNLLQIIIKFSLKLKKKTIFHIKKFINKIPEKDNEYRYFFYLYKNFENILKNKKTLFKYKFKNLIKAKNGRIIRRILKIAKLTKMNRVETTIFLICTTYSFVKNMAPVQLSIKDISIITEYLLNIDRLNILEYFIFYENMTDNPFKNSLKTYNIIKVNLSEEDSYCILTEAVFKALISATASSIFIKTINEFNKRKTKEMIVKKNYTKKKIKRNILYRIYNLILKKM